MSWASRKKTIYTVIPLMFVVFLAAIPLYFFFTKAPTCTDSKQNGDEEGIDCGGSCEAVCEFQIENIIVHWTRAFEVKKGVYDVVSYIENPNTDLALNSLVYKIKLYDDNNILISEKFGKTFAGKSEKLAIFYGGVNTGERIPKKVFLEFEPTLSWSKVDTTKKMPRILIQDQDLSNIEFTPKLTAKIVNNEPFEVRGIDVVAILYGADGNAIAVSKTYVDSISKLSNEQVSFTWHIPFDENPARIDIIPRLNIFDL